MTTASIPDGVRTLQGSSRYSKIDIAWRYVFVPAAGSDGVLPKIRKLKMSPMPFLTISLYQRKPSSQQMGRSSLSLGTILCLELEVRVGAKNSLHENSSLLRTIPDNTSLQICSKVHTSASRSSLLTLLRAWSWKCGCEPKDPKMKVCFY